MSLVEMRAITRTVILPDGSDLHILRGLDLTVNPGDHVSIVGRSGTGKSTLLNIIGLLDKPSTGDYLFAGKDVTRLGDATAARMRGENFGFVFQQFNLFPSRTAVENVAVPLLYAQGKKFWDRMNIAAELLDRVGLGERLDEYPPQLSGGEQQRIAIARALARSPRVILADEPTGALDPDTGREIMALLEEEAHKNDAALIVITHDLNVARRAQRVYHLADGVLSQIDHAAQVLVPTAPGGQADTGGAAASGELDGIGEPAGTGEPAGPSEPAGPGEPAGTGEHAGTEVPS
ncbi:ABC transporter ATP-binding protein [Trueperella bialowiezensis]|uniref:Macrolide export ATP-binding/permease protein MacB n=1 Tax=Trueperella bialowiezensis TaxID=312285 RepID=A0A448PEY2_9ACTO|nr:ABC transporter ATP-binding protein [Trueperella bialowiezensis]VEI13505.1 Macrolide export ATP-binding/permease protein MacB [Trueperella bialowiezensis]